MSHRPQRGDSSAEHTQYAVRHKPLKTFPEQNPQGETKEKILRKTTVLEAIERSFTTEPKGYIKRGCETVRNRCLKYNAILRTLYSIEREIPLEKAKEIFQKEMGIWDRTSLKAYFGTQETVSKRKMTRISRYPRTGTMSYKIIELEQPIKRKAGYLERLGLVCFEKRGNIWFMLLEEYNTILPELTHPPKPPLTRESESIEAKASIDKISLTPIVQGKEREKTVLEVVSPTGAR